ncbi:MAG: ArnT family glycosyltransferase [Paenirhodobacter sp.]|uniref:ArnT family glycosyltransferase n=1 Tax=Paenirhodobacter sp. TaxID=1965326 RepID=UPI003D0D0B7C
MQSANAGSERGWLGPALALVGAVTLARLVALAFDRTDLFVDETQYWLWGQRLDFGYYSKPPLIGWLIRAVTELAQSDAKFWVRMPGSVLHGTTALILGALAARIAGARAGFWAAALYVTLPFTALGSIMISTDTVMAPFYAAALLFFWRLGDGRRWPDAFALGLCAGLAVMAKYVGLFAPAGMLLAMLVAPSRRIGWGNAALALAVFALVIAPNVVWNMTHSFATLEHTMDNVGWVRAGESAGLNWASMGGFLGAQFGVFGPVTMLALIAGLVLPRSADKRALAVLVLPPLAVVTAQALLDKAYANWAITAYFPGVILAVLMLPRWGRWLAFVTNLVAVVATAALITLAPWPEQKGRPLLHRYLGRAELSTRILALAKANEVPVYASNRDILADLFYTGRDAGVTIYAPAPKGRAMSYYEQNFPLPADYTGQILVIRDRPLACNGVPMPPAGLLNGAGTWEGKGITPYLVPRDCLDAED